MAIGTLQTLLQYKTNENDLIKQHVQKLGDFEEEEGNQKRIRHS
jgi:hypothetical protein